MEIITLGLENIDQEHICCAISDKKCQTGIFHKKEWLKQRFPQGYRFKKINVRGKVFIEYVPAEYAWCPVDAPGYMFVHCFWVSGSYKNKGYGKQLLKDCLKEAQEMNGVVVVSSHKKRAFLSDKKFFTTFGFTVCDIAPPYFELLVKKNRHAPDPVFKPSAKENSVHNGKGIVAYYSPQCPYTDYYVNTELQKTADTFHLPLEIRKIESLADAKNAPTAFPLHSIFLHGKFLTHEILTSKRFEKLYHSINSKK